MDQAKGKKKIRLLNKGRSSASLFVTKIKMYENIESNKKYKKQKKSKKRKKERLKNKEKSDKNVK